MVMSTLHALSACSLPLTEGKPSVPNQSVLASKGRILLIEELRWSCPRHWIYLNLLKSKSFHSSTASSTNMAISTLISRRLEDLVSSSMIINELKSASAQPRYCRLIISMVANRSKVSKSAKDTTQRSRSLSIKSRRSPSTMSVSKNSLTLSSLKYLRIARTSAICCLARKALSSSTGSTLIKLKQICQIWAWWAKRTSGLNPHWANTQTMKVTPRLRKRSRKTRKWLLENMITTASPPTTCAPTAIQRNT